jgi:hypothetical protein
VRFSLVREGIGYWDKACSIGAARTHRSNSSIEVRFHLDIFRLRYVLVIFGLVAAFYCLASISIGRMPFASTSSWWMAIWPSHRVGVYVWFGLLNAMGAVIAAVPVSILLRWLIDGNRIRAAFTVRAPTAFLMIASVVAKWTGTPNHDQTNIERTWKSAPTVRTQ